MWEAPSTAGTQLQGVRLPALQRWHEWSPDNVTCIQVTCRSDIIRRHPNPALHVEHLWIDPPNCMLLMRCMPPCGASRLLSRALYCETSALLVVPRQTTALCGIEAYAAPPHNALYALELPASGWFTWRKMTHSGQWQKRGGDIFMVPW